MTNVSTTNTVDITTFKVPKYCLIFKSGFNSEIVKELMTAFCGYNNRSAIGKINEINRNGEGVVLTASKEVVNDLYEMLQTIILLNSIVLDMYVKEEVL